MKHGHKLAKAPQEPGKERTIMRRALLLSTLLLLTVLRMQSQTEKADGQPVAEPEFNDVFYRLDAGKLLPLERQDGVLKSKAKGYIVMSMKSEIEFLGEKSPVRFRVSDAPMEFVVRFPLSLASQDPSTMYHLRKLVTQKGRREAVLSSGHASPMGASMNSNLPEGPLLVGFTRYGSSSYRMTPPALAPGEYAFAYVLSGHIVFCFGVDK